MEPISTALTGIALARQGIEWLKANVDAASDAKAMAAQLTNVFQGHKDFNKQRYDGTLTLKEVAEQRIEMKLHQEKLMELRTLIDLRMGHGFYDSIQRDFQERLRKIEEEKKEQRRAAIRRRAEFARQAKVASIAMGFVTAIVSSVAYWVMSWTK